MMKMVKKIEITDPFTIAIIVIAFIVVSVVIVLTNSLPFISSGIKLGHNTDNARMLVFARKGDEVSIHHDVDVFNRSLEITFLKGPFILTGEKLWINELNPGKNQGNAVIQIPADGLYLVYLQEHSFAGVYFVNWKVTTP